MQGYPELSVPSRREFKPRRKNTDDSDVIGVQLDGAADDPRISAEPASPVTMREDGGKGTGRDVFAGPEIASEERFDAQRGEKIGGGLDGADGFRFTSAAQGETIACETGQRFKGLRLFPPVEVIRVRGVPGLRA